MNTTEIQDALKRLGYAPGPVDGIAGLRTLAAVRAFQASKGLAVDGKAGPLTQAALTAALAGSPSSPPPSARPPSRPPVPGHPRATFERVRLDGEDEVRANALALASYATDGANGRGIRWDNGVPTEDGIHHEVTEGRRLEFEIAFHRGDAWAVALAKTGGFSTCGELPHWLLYRLGCREPWINRAAFTGWRGGKNITLLDVSGCTVRPSAGSAARPKPGDVIMLRGAPGTEHVEVVAEWNEDDSGYVAHAGGQPHLARVTRRVSTMRGAFMVGAKSVIWWLDLDRVPLTVQPELPTDA
jgi:hypothetical protein